MQIALENKKKPTSNSLRSALKKKNGVEEGGTSTLGVKRKHENTNLKAQKMMKGIVEPSVVPTMVRAVPPMVHGVRQIAAVPQMTSPHER
jgi:hypothetical protein